MSCGHLLDGKDRRWFRRREPYVMQLSSVPQSRASLRSEQLLVMLLLEFLWCLDDHGEHRFV